MKLEQWEAPPVRDEQRGDKELGQKLFDLRVDHGLTQSDVAEASGVSRGMISRIETGGRNLSFPTFIGYTKLFGHSAVDLVMKHMVGNEYTIAHAQRRPSGPTG